VYDPEAVQLVWFRTEKKLKRLWKKLYYIAVEKKVSAPWNKFEFVYIVKKLSYRKCSV
jgi:hypothetical protein